MGKDGYAAVGQFKMFAKNAPTMEAQKRAIRKQWKERSLLLYKNRPEVFFHMFMISTLASAEELYADAVKKPGHQDELWFWVPQDKQAQHRLDLFIQHFSRGERVEEDGITILKVDAGSIKSRKTDVAIYL